MDVIVALLRALCCIKLCSELIVLGIRTATLNAIEKVHGRPGDDCTIDLIRVLDTHPRRQQASVATTKSDDLPQSPILLLQFGQG